MTESIKASRASVQIGALEVDGFMLPDGSYRMSLTQAALSVEKTAQGISNFLKSKTLKRLLAEAGSISNFLKSTTVAALVIDTYTPDQFLVNIGDEGSQGFLTPKNMTE